MSLLNARLTGDPRLTLEPLVAVQSENTAFCEVLGRSWTSVTAAQNDELREQCNLVFTPQS